MAECYNPNCIKKCPPKPCILPIYDVVSDDTLIVADKQKGSVVRLSGSNRLARAVEKIEKADLASLEELASDVKVGIEVLQEDVDLLKQSFYKEVTLKNEERDKEIASLKEMVEALKDKIGKEYELEKEIIHAEKNSTNVREFAIPEELKDKSEEELKKAFDIFVNGVRQKTGTEENHYELSKVGDKVSITINNEVFNPEEDCVYAVVNYLKEV